MSNNRPIPNRLSDWGDRTEIIFQCPKCGQEFNIYGNQEKYCHSCGTKLEWEGLPTHCTISQRARADEIFKDYTENHHDYKLYQEQMRNIYFEIYVLPTLNELNKKK